jgi:hypothetical protein
MDMPTTWRAARDPRLAPWRVLVAIARIYDFSSQAGLLFFADRRSASRYFQTCYACLPSMQEEVIADLDRLRPNLVIYRTGTHFDAIDRVPATTRHPLIAGYHKTNYVQAANIGKVLIWQRRPENAPTDTKPTPK